MKFTVRGIISLGSEPHGSGCTSLRKSRELLNKDIFVNVWFAQLNFRGLHFNSNVSNWFTTSGVVELSLWNSLGRKEETLACSPRQELSFQSPTSHLGWDL